MTILIADLGLTALVNLQTVIVQWGAPIVVVALSGIMITYAFGREEWHSMLGGLDRWVVAGGAIIGGNALALALGL